MPLKSELIADVRRGPGHGLLRISGLTPDLDPLEPLSVRIMQNQQGGRYLTSTGAWQAEEVSQILPAPGWDGAVAVVPLGPTLFDPLAQLPNNVRLRMWVTYGAAGPEMSSLSLVQPLPPSFARGEAPEPVMPPPPPPPPVMAEELIPEPEPLLPEPNPQRIEPPLREEPPELIAPARDPLPEKPKSPLLPLLIGLLVLLILGGGAAWKFGLLDSLLGGAKPAATDAQAPASAINTREDLARYLGGNPAAAEIITTAQDLTTRGKLDLAMLAWQQASRQGSPEAGLALGKMYDPATWSAATSPLPQADAETAAFWYEPAAQAGNVEAQRRLGLVLKAMEPGGSGPQTDKAKEWLKKAADAGDAEAAAALK
ncbi:sel1 repeat family protein [Novispirillum itersonii]|uniref:Sel1 repeat family protein n=1 Tax=Novispirillum itersonii TaxID=189 RepID=A0A7W9ZIS2_NOVIT|nr:sel1 repeat family protein [Novispirillum itersonii]MBB6212243.1 hypothetical protein [Novispirillum itersonii]